MHQTQFSEKNILYGGRVFPNMVTYFYNCQFSEQNKIKMNTLVVGMHFHPPYKSKYVTTSEKIRHICQTCIWRNARF